MRIILLSFILLVFNVFTCFAQQDKENDYFVFSYFYDGERQNEGLHLAISCDGIHWTSVKNDSAIFHPGFGTRFRDPSLIKDPHDERLFHMVWTTERKDGFGIASSYDLINWFDVREVLVNKNIKDVINTWAPELFWDGDNKQWMAYWGSSIEGRFPETAKLSKNPKANNRMYYSVSKDLKEWSEPELLQDYGFPSNDAYIYKLPANNPNGKYMKFVKHIVTPGYNAQIRIAYSHSLYGPYRLTDKYVTKKYKFMEGPNLLKIGDYYYLNVDLSREHRMALFRTKCLDDCEWEDLTDLAKFPKASKHGCIISISKEIYKKLLDL